jgi:predicted transcriptional regulator
MSTNDKHSPNPNYFYRKGDPVMSSLLEMATEIVAAHASTTALSKEELLSELQEIHKALAILDKGETVALEGGAAAEEQAPAVSKRKAFGKTHVVCMVCGKGGMKTLTRHLKTAHNMKPGEYRKQFGIPSGTPLAAKDYSESRRQMAIDRGLGENLAKARAARGKAKAPAGAAKTKSAKKPAAKKPAGKPATT